MASELSILLKFLKNYLFNLLLVSLLSPHLLISAFIIINFSILPFLGLFYASFYI